MVESIKHLHIANICVAQHLNRVLLLVNIKEFRVQAVKWKIYRFDQSILLRGQAIECFPNLVHFNLNLGSSFSM
ncbi:hypothetical protein V6N13_103033 [Hibiscus sabdariffa]